MSSSTVLMGYKELLEQLKALNKETESKVIDEIPDEFITKNVNFFTKSFMITLCAYLESFLKDVCMTLVDDANKKLDSSKVSYNLVKWSVLKKKELGELNDNELKFEDLSIKITKKELDGFISGSPYKTENLFKKFGIELYKDVVYIDQKEKMIAIVEKRNKIVHHNDNASDISFTDIESNIVLTTSYIENLSRLVNIELAK